MRKMLILVAALALVLAVAASPGLASGSRTPSPPTATDDHGRGTEPGDDRGAAAQPGDDRGGAVEPGDDRGSAVEPGDDRGNDAAKPATTKSRPVTKVRRHELERRAHHGLHRWSGRDD